MKKTNFYLMAFALMMGGMLSISLTSCNGHNQGPDTGGKVDPSTIATNNLIAYFPFEGNGIAEVGGYTPSNADTKTTFVTGRRGQAFQGDAAGDKASGLLYNLSANDKLKTLKAFSFSLWVKQVANTLETADVPEQMVFHLNGTGDWIWGNLFLLQHRNWPEGETEQDRNFAQMDCYFWKDDAADWKGQRGNGWFVDVTAPQWRHIICTYDNVTSTFHAYVNGVHVTAFDGTEYMGVNRTQGEGGAPFGDLNFVNAEKLAIGAWCDRLDGTALQEDAWATPFKGQIDEFRIYDRALTTQEVKDLYDAEITQVN
jgi:hypothetical protein